MGAIVILSGDVYGRFIDYTGNGETYSEAVDRLLDEAGDGDG